MLQHSNRTRLEFDLYADVINTADAFKLSRLICNQFGRGVITMMGAVSPDSFDTLHSYANTFQMPFITPWFPEKVIPPSSKTVDYALSLRPDYHRAVIDTVSFYGWKNVIYIYDSHDGLLRLQQLYTSLHPGRATFRISNVKRVANGSDVVEFLNSIERLDRWSNKYVILDSSTQLAKETIILHVRDVHLGRRNYHYFLSGLVMDDRWDKRVTEFGAINITGFRVLDRSKQVLDFFTAWKSDSISAQAALMHDGVLVLIDSFQRLMKKKPDFIKAALRRTPGSNSSKFIDCNPSKDIVSPYEYGEKISRMMKKVEVTGLTGHVRFDELGHRKNFTLQVMEMNIDRDLIKVATWYDHKGLIPEKGREPAVNVPFIYDRNKTYIVSTIEETPYAMRNSGENSANDPHKGFCVDLTKMLADALEIKYDIHFVKDGLYGAENPKRIGGWDGMIGELLRKEVDLIIAPLTVTLQREQVIDFSRPFLSFDIEHNLNNSRGSDSIFSFLDPLSTELWLCIMCSIFAVSIVLFIVSRFSPYEWRLVSYTDSQSSEQADVVATTKTTVINEFSFWNSLWFSLGSFMQQGSDITPRSISGRIVCIVWYTFALIFVCFYTANLASSITLARMSDNDYCKVTSCPLDTIAVTKTTHRNQASDDYGWFAYLLDGSSEIEETGKIKPCEMIVTPKNNGFKEFAVGVPKGSQLRDGVNLVLNILKENGQMNKLIQKWFVKQECDGAQQINQDNELTLGNLAGLFYVLMGGMGLSLTVALLEFCYYGRAEAARANVPLRAALTAKARLATRAERKSPPNRTLQREHDRLGWNGGAYAGYYTPANQIGQEETALHASFTQV